MISRGQCRGHSGQINPRSDAINPNCQTAAPQPKTRFGLSLSADSALAKCDDFGIVVAISPTGNLAYTAPDGLPDDVREALKVNKPEIIAFLSAHPVRPMPDVIPFLTRKIGLYYVRREMAGPIGFAIGGQTYYRVTPRVHAWAVESIDANIKAANVKPEAIRELERLNRKLCDYINAHYRRDQIERGHKLRSSLPDYAIPPMLKYIAS